MTLCFAQFSAWLVSDSVEKRWGRFFVGLFASNFGISVTQPLNHFSLFLNFIAVFSIYCYFQVTFGAVTARRKKKSSTIIMWIPI